MICTAVATGNEDDDDRNLIYGVEVVELGSSATFTSTVIRGGGGAVAVLNSMSSVSGSASLMVMRGGGGGGGFGFGLQKE